MVVRATIVSYVPPSIVVEIDGLKHLTREGRFELPSHTVARVWNDCAPYYRTVSQVDYRAISQVVVTANHTRFESLREGLRVHEAVAARTDVAG